MVIIVKRLVPIYTKKDNVPRKYLNLRKAVYVTSFAKLYPNIVQILTNEYGLESREKVVVFWTKAISKPGWNHYRLPFRKVYSGPLNLLQNHLKKARGEST
jgi:hypothetical protein